jgi:hypothetical protein
MMTHPINTDILNALADAAPSEELLEKRKPGREGQTATWNEPDDGVEALIISLDRTTAEHLFLQAQRDMQRDAAKALLAAER